MPVPYVFTFGDAMESLDYTARGMGVGSDITLRQMCLREAYRQIAKVRDWSCLHHVARLQLRAPQTTGTVVFDLTGGTYERMLTLTDATWPEAWVADASVRFGDIVCDVEDYKTSTIITLAAGRAPIADVASTTYSLFPRWYRLPNDLMSMAQPMDESSWVLGTPLSKEEIELLNRYQDAFGDIQFYAVATPPDLYGATALFIHPPTSTSKTLDIPYIRRPRDIVYSGHNSSLDCVGTIAVTAESPTVTGSSTAFASAMAGSILRIGTGSERPTGIAGVYPYGEQQSIKSVESATSLTLTADVATSRGIWQSGVGYSISDPIDLDVDLYDAFMRCAEMRLAKVLRAKVASSAERDYQAALFLAKEADHQMHQPRRVGGRQQVTRLADSPLSRRV